MQFYEKNNCQVMMFRLYTVYNKHEAIKMAMKPEKIREYYHKCSNNFAADCSLFIMRFIKIVINVVYDHFSSDT